MVCEERARLDIGEEKRGMPDWENCLRKGRVKEPRTADP